MTAEAKIKDYSQMSVSQQAHELVVLVYSLCKNLPDEEKFALSSQLRRAAVSVTSNIAEGFNRRTIADKTHFYTIAQGSVAEIQSQLKVLLDLAYCSQSEYQTVLNLTIKVHKMLSGLIKAVRSSS